MTTYDGYKRKCIENKEKPLPYYEWFEKERKNFDMDYYKKNNLKCMYVDYDKELERKIKLEKYEDDLNYAIARHKKYIVRLTIGTILCMSAFLWVPFLAGFIKDFGAQRNGSPSGIVYNCVSGFMSVCLWLFFTAPISIPLCIFGSVTLWPLFLKKLMFYEYPDKEFHKDSYYPQILEFLKCKNIEASNALAVLSSTLLL